MSQYRAGTSLVTGASRGIGRAIAVELASRGDFVVVNYARDEAGARETLREIQSCGGRGMVHAADVGDPQQVARLFETIENEAPEALSVLVNNAGIKEDCLALEVEPESLRQIMRVNFEGAFYCAQHALRGMMMRKYGRIIQVGSVMAERPNRGVSAYAASKGALHALTRALAVECGGRGVTVNAVAPGFVATRMTEEYELAGSGKGRRKFLHNGLGRFGTVEEVAATVAFLASEDSSYIHGQIMTVDGGHAPMSAVGGGR